MKVIKKKQQKKNRAAIVVGPESSGTRLVARTIAHNWGITEYDRWSGHNYCSSLNDFVIHRSLPHGVRQAGKYGRFPDIIELYNQLNERYEVVRVVIVIRDQEASLRSKTVVHCKNNFIIAKQEQEQALSYCREILLKITTTNIFSYDTFVALGEAYLARLFVAWNEPVQFMPQLKNENMKYYQALPEELAVT